MGYSEILCQICRVSFNIGRLRTVNEPQEMAWDETGFSSGKAYLMARHFTEKNCPPGCMVALRELKYPSSYIEKGYADPADGGDPPGAFTPAGSTEVFYPECPDPVPEDGIDRRFKGIGCTHGLEHIAGPKCDYGNWLCGGYNCHNISVEEMRGCNTSQCLVQKGDDWESADDDEEFEREGRFFLSVLSDEMPGRPDGSPSTFPDRHGCSEPYAENYIFDDDVALPFHPTSLEVFRRASLHRSEKIDYEALEGWWKADDFDGLPHDPEYRKSSEWWVHCVGYEWLAANGCFVPGLEQPLSTAQRGDSAVRSTANNNAGRQSAGPSDVFAQLPQEIRTMIVVELDMADVAALRVASRSFWSLPQTVARALMIVSGPGCGKLGRRWITHSGPRPPPRSSVRWTSLATNSSKPSRRNSGRQRTPRTVSASTTTSLNYGIPGRTRSPPSPLRS